MTTKPAPTGRRFSREQLDQLRTAIVLPVVALLMAVVVGSFFIYAADLIANKGAIDLLKPLTAYVALIKGSLIGFDPIVSTLVAASPLVFGGLAVALGFKAGLFNIGVQGQLLMGVLGAVAVGVALSDQPVIIAAPIAFIAGTLAGAAFGFVPGFLKAVSGAHEVVTTIMLNYVALNILAAFVSGPLRVPKAPAPVTFDVGNAALPIVPRQDRAHRDRAGGDRRGCGLVAAVPHHARLRDPDGRGESGRRAVRRHATAPTGDADDDPVRRPGRDGRRG